MATSVSSLSDLLERANGMIAASDARIKILNDVHSAYEQTLEEGIVNPPPWILTTKDTQPTDSINWLTDILAGAQPTPQFEIPDDAIEANVILKSADAFKRLVWTMIPWLKEANKPKSTSDQMAESMEQQVKAIFEQNDERKDQLLHRQFAFYGFLFDAMVAKVVDLRVVNLWSGEDVEQEGKSPLAIIARDPREIHAEWNQSGLACVLERSIVQLRDIKAQYPDADYSNANDLTDLTQNVALCEIWTNGEMAAWIERVIRGKQDEDSTKSTDKTAHTIVLQAPKANPFSFIPFIIKCARGTWNEPQPILKPGVVSNLFIRANLFLTMAATESYKAAIGQYVRIGAPPNSPPMQLDFTQPHVYDVTGSGKLEPLVSPLSNAVMGMIPLMTEKSSQTTVSKVLAGQGTGGVTAASALNQLYHGARLLISPVAVAGQAVYEGVSKMVYLYVRAYAELDEENQGLKLYTNGGTQEIDPKQLPKWFSARWIWQPDLPQDRLAMAQVIRALMPMGLMPKKLAWEWLKIEDVNKVQKWLAEEQAEPMTQALNARSQQPPQGQPPDQGNPQNPLDVTQQQPMPQQMVDQNPTVQDQASPESMLGAMNNANVTQGQ